MVPNNLEKQIKEQINTREINPSEAAWDRLDSMLTVAEAKTHKPFLWQSFLAIAATVLLFIGVGLFFFNQKSTFPNQQNEVVIEENINSNGSQNSISNQNGIEKNQVTESSNQKSIAIKLSNINQKKAVNQNFQNPKPEEVSIQKPELIAQNQTSIESIPEKSSNQKSININANDLLASVEKTIKNDSKPGIKVNVSTLLSQVDQELQQSYRETVITKIEKKFQNIKVAYSNRNQIQ